MSALLTKDQHGFGINHQKRAKLRNMKVFVLDNSLRESTVAQTAGHTLANKVEILKQIEKCGFENVIVAAFGGLSDSDRRVDDAFCENLVNYCSQASMANAWTYAFSEVSDSINTKDGKMAWGEENIPAGMQKIRRYGISSAIIEIDVEYTKTVPVSVVIDALKFLLTWANTHLQPLKNTDDRHRHMVNLRDLPVAMLQCPQRTLDLVEAIAKLPTDIRPCGLIFEEPLGEYFGDEVANWTSFLRKIMDSNDWKSKWQQDGQTVDGILLYHVHEQYGLANATVLDALAAGADGMWCGLSEEGAPMGHACSAVALTNLARLGNEHVKTKYIMKNLVEAANTVASETTGTPVPSNQIVYGSGAVDVCFSFGSIAQGTRADNVDYNGDGILDDLDKFSVARQNELEDPPIRISTLASPGLITKRFRQLFDDKIFFTDENSKQLLVEIKRRLEMNIKEEYVTKSQLGKLWKGIFPQFQLE